MIGDESEVSTSFQTIDGIRFSEWFSGIGIGLDYYRYRTLPLFFDVRRYFGNEKKAFVYGDLRYNFPMPEKPGKEIYYTSYHFTGGIYTDIGIGYQLPLYKKTSFVFNLGYSYKKLQNIIKTELINPFTSLGVFYNKYEFCYGRILLKTGLVF